MRPTMTRPTARAGKPDAKADARFWKFSPVALATGENGAETRSAELFIYGYIGIDNDPWSGEEIGKSAKGFLDDLRALGAIDELHVHINSPGGDCFDGNAIYDILAAHPAKKTVTIEGLAASMASVIALAGDTVRATSKALFMIHEASTFAYGRAKDLQSAINALNALNDGIVKVYAGKATLSEDEIRAAMDAETWYTAEQMLAAGFIDEIVEPVKATAHFDIAAARFKNAPAAEVLAEIVAAEPVEEGEPEPAPEPAPEPEAVVVPPPAVEPESAQVVALRKLATIAGESVRAAFDLHVEAKAPIEKLQEIVFGASAEVAKVVAVKAANPGIVAPTAAKESVEERRRKADAKFNQWPIPKA